jgi:biopolymer transport protein ExbD
MAIRIKRANISDVEIDMTPMIDMTFQLIAFFMILINFDAGEQDERIQLPISVLAKPPDNPLRTPITIQLTRDGQPVVGGQVYADIASIRPILENEKYVLLQQPKGSEKDATIVIRAHRDLETGKVQNVIQLCQEIGFEKFTLRAKEGT